MYGFDSDGIVDGARMCSVVCGSCVDGVGGGVVVMLCDIIVVLCAGVGSVDVATGGVGGVVGVVIVGDMLDVDGVVGDIGVITTWI